MKKNNIHFYLLVLIFLGSSLVRLYRFDGPIADWHSWRQADTSAVSRNFVKNGFDILHPRFDDISNVPSKFDNPEGYRFVEFPIFNIKQALLSKYIGILSLEEWGRIVSILSSLLTMLFLYLMVKRHSNKEIGLLTAFFYGFTPFNIYYGRTILPDSTMVAAMMGGIYFFDLYVSRHSGERSDSRIPNKKAATDSGKARMTEKSAVFFILSLLFTASALLLKPYAVFFTLPMLVLAYNTWGFGSIKNWRLWIFAIFSIAPLILWRMWMTQFPSGIPSNEWLLNGNGIRFRPSFFRWILYERITKLISGYLGVIFLLYGALNVRKLKEWMFLSAFLVSSILYVTVFATGNVQHDYYQILIMPSLAIFFAIGAFYLYQFSFRKIPAGKIILVISLASLLWFGWKQVKDYFNINNRSIIAAGKAVDRLTPKDALVLANYDGDTSFLYQTNRKGWASFQHPLPELIKKGADYLVLVNPTENDLKWGETYKIVEQTPQYAIFDLHENVSSDR